MNSMLHRLRSIAAAVGFMGAVVVSLPAQATVFTSWTFPANNTSYAAGTTLTLTGNANTSSLITGGLDLAVVLDSSGSMCCALTGGKTRQQWQQDAANALVAAVPSLSTSVAVVEFDSDANLLVPLTPVSSGLAAIQAGIDSVDASGGTTIGAGIARATTELTGPNHIAGRTQMMVVVSDGSSSGDPGAAAAAALVAGIEAVHSVGIPGHDPATMQDIATSGNGVYSNVSSDLTALINLFSGIGGNLVGIDHVDLTMNDGTVFNNIAIDGLGNFSTPLATIFAGINTFVVTAFDDDGNSASASLVLIGTTSNGVPLPGSFALVGLALLVAGATARRRA